MQSGEECESTVLLKGRGAMSGVRCLDNACRPMPWRSLINGSRDCVSVWLRYDTVCDVATLQQARLDQGHRALRER
jgi:hypothetical protein